MITKRDQQVLELLDTFNCATTSQIKRLFYTDIKAADNRCQRRMRVLYEDEHVKRVRNSLNMEYVYYIRKNNQFTHSLILTELYISLHETGAEIDRFEVEQPYDKIRPDGMCICGYKGFTHYFFIEVHVSNNLFNQDKYITYYGSRQWKNQFDVFPKVVIVSNKNINLKPSNLKFIQIQTNCEDIQKIFRG